MIDPRVCELCGDKLTLLERKDYGNRCEYCALQNERVESYRETQHPDEV